MLHLAAHDALQAIAPIYEAFAYQAEAPAAHPVAAVAHASWVILADAYPDRVPDLDAELRRWMDQVPNDSGAEAGAELGRAAARHLITTRADDGWDRPGSYQFRSGPGAYRTTPPWDGFTLQPGFRVARPFSFDDPARFRPPPPPALTSPEYAEALTEVRAVGDSLSGVRTDEQTAYALWWMEFAESSVGRLTRALLEERAPNLWDANRLLAHLYVALFDAYVSNWDSKYEFNHWRPYTAIRAADEDDNPATDADPDWAPLRPTPPFPEYASAHATGCSAAFEVARDFFGDGPFEATSLTAPPGMPTRAFPDFRAAAAECADSRIRLGWHFRYATDAGLDAGRSVAGHVTSTLLRPR
jgi:hypothetical protein